MKTPIRTQNSTEMATAENAVTATIAASKRVARRWYASARQSTMCQAETIRMPASAARGMKRA